MGCLPSGVFAQRNCWANTLFFCRVKNFFRGVLKIPSEEISLGTDESTLDHVMVSASILDSGAVTGAAVWYGEGFDMTDHSPMIVDLDL